MIEIKEVNKSYAQHKAALENINLNIPEYKLTCIIGGNGAGKSTLIKAIGRLLAIDAGVIKVNGLNVHTTASPIIARQLAILRQQNTLDYKINVQELVMFGRFPYNKGNPTSQDITIVADALHYLDISDLARSYINELSGGQQQRAFLAMILAQDTPYILLDEPLAGLDIKAQCNMMKLLKLFTNDLHKTVVAIMHDINLVANNADYIIALKAGKVIAQGLAAEVINPPVLNKIYDIKAEVIYHNNKPICIFD